MNSGLKNDMNDVVEISIIIPVYNVYDWLDECMESVVGQSFGMFEILLIDDGSTDGSGSKCDEWADKDKRIKVFHKKNEGVWPSRNFGIQEAKGKYIAFVDPDDWLDKQYMEKLYRKALETDADIVGCDFWRFNDKTKEKTYRACYGHTGKEYTAEENIIYGEFVMWAYLSKKEIWIRNHIILPDCLGASHAAYVLLLVLGTKIVHVHEPLYFYRRLRKGSLLDINGKGTFEEGKMGLAEVDFLIDELKERKLYEQNQRLVERAVKYRLSDLLAGQFSRKSHEEFDLQAENYYQYMEKKFPGMQLHKYLNIGGYNLNRILVHLPELHNPKCRFNFSSIMSIMHPSNPGRVPKHKNRYRQIMIDRDISSFFWKYMEQVRPQYVFMDFIEERFDVIETSDGGIITKSDALDGAEDCEFTGRTISRMSDACWEQWKSDLHHFYARLVKYIPASHFLLVENYLSEKKGSIDFQEEYQNMDEIRKINDLLGRYYAYAEQNCKGITCVKAYECENYFTDAEYEYGAVPSHLNEVVNGEIAEMIEKNMVR